jgi:hypothetical protein
MLGIILQRSFKILRENLIIVQPFILFLLLISFLATSVQNIPSGKSPALIVFLVSLFALSCAFLAGWFQLFQAAIRNSRREFSSVEEKVEASMNSFREFLPAVGRFFIPITIAVVLYIVMFFGVMKLVMLLGMKYIGFTQNISPNNMMSILSDQSKIKPFVESLTQIDRNKLFQWDMLMLCFTGLFSYLTMFWFPAIMLNGENPFKALFTGIKSALGHPLDSLGIFFTYWIVNILTSFIGALTAGFFVFELLNLMLVVFVTVYFIMVNFVYFEEYSADHIAGWTNLFR